MTAVTPVQIRGARAMLGWSLVDLAKAARVSVATLKRVEDGAEHPSLGVIRDTLETEGVSFLQDDGSGPGMRLRARSATCATVDDGTIVPHRWR